MPRIRPQSNNIKIKVSTQQTDDTVNVSTTNGTNPVKASNNMAEYWSNKSKEWAISENIVDNTDHSSKYYAEQAKEAYDGIDELVNGFEQTVEDATTNSIEEITESKDDAIADIIIEGGNQVTLVESTGGDLLTQMTSLKDATLGYKNDAQSSANSASVSETNAHTYEANALTYSNSASGSASIATQKATEAASSAINASESELNALAYSNSASTSASNALTSENNASTSETNAQTYANNANTSATNAATSEDNANIWAEGSDAEVQALGGVHSAKGWAEESASGQVQSDYTESDSTKKSFIKNKPDLTVYATQTDLTNGLATKQDTISDLSTIRSNATNGQSAYTTIGGYGDIVTHNASEFATSAQGSLADTSIQPNDNISLLNNNAGFITGIDSTDVITALGYTPYDSTNPNGYTSNVGTVTSVNNTQPDANGNVTISVTGGANTDLSNLTATGEAHFQEPLVSGTNIKTVNNTSLLGSGNIDTSEIFVATYGTTTFQQISDAFNANKAIFCKRDDSYKTMAVLKDYGTTYFTFFGCQPDGSVRFMVNSSNTWTSNTYTCLTSSSSEVASSRFDGQWVRKFSTLANDVSMGNDTSKTYSLASYLPDATYDYEVMFSGLVITASSSGKFLKMVLGSSVVNNIWVCDARTRTSSTMEATGSCIIPISKNSQQIVMKSEASSNSSGTMSLVALAYRRIGTNT